VKAATVIPSASDTVTPRRLGDRVFDRTLGQSYFRRWTSDSLDGLRAALARAIS
jgi:hypothetical protein